VTFSTSDTDPGILLPANYTFTAADAGVHTFTGGVSLSTPGAQTIMATDMASGITRSATVTVAP
jgi:adhesin/invasin